METILNYIDGKFRPSASGRSLPNFDPARGRPYSTVPDSDAIDARAAVAAARDAYKTWSRTPIEERAGWLLRVADAISKESAGLARWESIDTGKPITLAAGLDIPRSQINFEFFAKEARDFKGESFISRHSHNVTQYSPLGPVVCISPWNLPLYLLTWKIAPALVTGNTVIAKPSEVTPMTAFRLSHICADLGFPPGVLNILHGRGSEIGATLVGDSAIKAVSFTGSTATGRAIAQATAGSFKKVSLEMGGKNPNIIFADCDFELALETTVRSSFSNQGQICLCGSRILVERSIYHRFRDALVTRTKALIQGDPLHPETQQGALVSQVQMEKVLGYIELAQKEGGRILCGGKRVAPSPELAQGYFVAPTLIEGLGVECRTNQDEIFGPVATLIPFDTEEEAIRMANATRYGLSASVWTRDTQRANRMASSIEAGVVWINAWMLRDLRIPFGGMKDSGVGREGGQYGLRFFSEVKNVCKPGDPS